MKYLGFFLFILLLSSFVEAVVIEQTPQQNQDPVGSSSDLALISDKQSIILQKLASLESQASHFTTKEEQIQYLNAGFTQMASYLDEKINFLIMIVSILSVAILAAGISILLILKGRRRL